MFQDLVEIIFALNLETFDGYKSSSMYICIFISSQRSLWVKTLIINHCAFTLITPTLKYPVPIFIQIIKMVPLPKVPTAVECWEFEDRNLVIFLYSHDFTLFTPFSLWCSSLLSLTLFFFFNLFIYLFVVNFVIHWNETAVGLHVFPIPIPPPTSLSTRSP